MYYGERFNSISHLVGAGLAVLGSVVLMPAAASSLSRCATRGRLSASAFMAPC